MRVIDHPHPDCLILGSDTGQMYACAPEVWLKLYASEYESAGILVQQLPPGRREWLLATVRPLPPHDILDVTEPTPIDPDSVIKRRVCLHAYACANVIRLYGFDLETITFFVSEGTA